MRRRSKTLGNFGEKHAQVGSTGGTTGPVSSHGGTPTLAPSEPEEKPSAHTLRKFSVCSKIHGSSKLAEIAKTYAASTRFEEHARTMEVPMSLAARSVQDSQGWSNF